MHFEVMVEKQVGMARLENLAILKINGVRISLTSKSHRIVNVVDMGLFTLEA